MSQALRDNPRQNLGSNRFGVTARLIELHDNTTTAQDWQELHIEPEMVLVPAGPFLMGTSDRQKRASLRRYDWPKSCMYCGS